MRWSVLWLLILSGFVVSSGCKPKDELPPLTPESATILQAEEVPRLVQDALRKDHPKVKVDKVLKEIVGGDLHYFIKYTEPSGRKGEVEYSEKGELAMPRPQR